MATLTHSTLAESKDDGRSPTDQDPTSWLILILQRDQLAEAPARFPLGQVSRVMIGRAQTRGTEVSPDGRDLHVRVADPRMSVEHARLLRLARGWVIEDGGSRNGTFVDGQKVQRLALEDGCVLELGRTFFLFRTSTASLAASARDPDRVALAGRGLAGPGLVTLSPDLEAAWEQLAAIAATPAPVLLLGESGVGKEVAARAVHALSGRPGPLVAVNCAALPETLLLSELFGHRKGAFSGALEDRPGLVRSADRGTLFLDEIGDLPLPAQAALLRVLQEREVLPVGGTRAVPVDIRLMAATHRPLRDMVRQGRFREDLLGRIAAFEAHLPPLRQRLEDLGLLMGALLERQGKAPARVKLGQDAARALLGYDWPLNIRELEHTLSTATVLAGDGPLGLQHLPRPLRAALEAEGQRPGERSEPLAGSSSRAGAAGAPLPLEGDALRERLVALLKEHEGNVSAVARELGKARVQVHRWLRRFGLSLDDFRGP